MKHVSVESRGEVAIVRLDRPPANAMDPELVAEVTAVLDDLAAAEPGAVVLTGREGFFSAGADLKAVPDLDPAGQRAMVDAINAMALGWYAFPRPVVCAVNGHAIAGGLVLALCADWRVGARAGKYGLTELVAGIPYPIVAMGVVRAELPAPVARRLVLRSHLVEADDALALELFDELVEPGAVLDRALERAAELAAHPRDGYTLIKRQLRGATTRELARLAEDDPLHDAGWVVGGAGA